MEQYSHSKVSICFDFVCLSKNVFLLFFLPAPADITEPAEGSYWNYRCSAVTAGTAGELSVSYTLV